jgi:hypothetical protein
VIRVVMWAGRLGPGRASAGALVDAPGADRERVRRAVLACGVGLAADRLAAASGDDRRPVIQAFGASSPDDLVDLTGRCRIGGLSVPPAEVTPPPGAAIADLILAPGDDPDDAEPVVAAGDIAPAEAAALAAAALARALPRDPLHLARTGVALRALAREASVYPDTLVQMAAGIAVTARDPEDVRLFTGPGDSGGDRPRMAWRMRDGRALGVAMGTALLTGAMGAGIAWLALALTDPDTANRTTALLLGGVLGALAGAGLALRAMRS